MDVQGSSIEDRGSTRTPQRVAVVSGANRGIGLAVVDQLSAHGVRVIALYRSGEPPRDPDPDVTWYRCDLLDPDDVTRLEQFLKNEPSISILVHCAGILEDTLTTVLSDASFDRVLQTNLYGAFRLARAVLPHLIAQKFGRIVFVSSIGGFTGAPGQAGYSSSKAALLGLARSISAEVARRGITANVVAPGLIETEMITDLPDKRRRYLVDQTHTGRVGQAPEIASVVNFLCSDNASYITGACVPVSGGAGLGL